MPLTRPIGILSILLVWLAALLCLAEISLRYYSTAPIPNITPDPVLGWRYSPGLKLTNFRSNSAGFRDRDHAETKAAGTYRVLILGDSYPSGNAVPAEANFPSQLERNLNQAGLRAEVINASVSAWATDQELLYYLHEGYRLHPDLVVLAVVPNDLRENYGKRFFALTPAAQLVEPPRVPLPLRDRALWWLLNHSAIVQWLGQRYSFNDVYLILRHTYQLSFPLGSGQCTDFDLLHAPPDPGLAPAHALFAALVERLHLAVRSDHAELALAVMPTKIEFSGPTPFHPLVTPGLVSRFVGGLAKGKELPFVDLFAAFRAQKKPLALFLDEEYHFNETGHQTVARTLADWILARRRAQGTAVKTVEAPEVPPAL